MKAKLCSGAIIAVMMLSTGAWAETARPGMPMMDMGAMQEQMNQMQKTMERVHQSKSVQEQQRLMQQHMDEMHRGMGMMGGMMSGDMPMGKAGGMPRQMGGGQMQEQVESRRNMMGGKGEEMDPDTLGRRYRMMEQRMDMMQGMMGQIMEHMKQQERMGMGKK